MSELSQAFSTAFALILGLDAQLLEIVGLSVRVSLTALVIASILALPLGAALAIYRFRGRGLSILVLNALMGLPPVVVGLLVYLLLSRSGPLGDLGLLFTPSAMVIAQVILIAPIVAALARQSIEDLWAEYEEQLRSLGTTATRALPTLLWEGRHSLFTCVLAGFGRAIAEVGAVIIVGGNIAHVTRVMTTAITLETRKGDLALALALGIVLLLVSAVVNAAAAGVRASTEARA